MKYIVEIDEPFTKNLNDKRIKGLIVNNVYNMTCKECLVKHCSSNCPHIKVTEVQESEKK